jgi:hypothetical protein
LTLFSDASPQTPLVISPTDFQSRLQLKIANSTADDPPTEFLTAWQVRLEIVPDAGAAGTLEFETAAEPENYVFDGANHFGPTVVPAGDRLFASDFNFPNTGGVQVPAAPGTGLLSIQLAPQPGALGRFGVYALAGLTNCEWTDAASPVRQRRTFANVPDAGGPVRIADVLMMSAGDYNHNGAVDAADYVLWRDTLGQMGAGLAADGNNNGQIDAGDFDVWRANFGLPVIGASASAGLSSSASSVPEPASTILGLFALPLLRRRPV